MQNILEHELCTTLKPLCPRDDHLMRYEVKGIRWREEHESHVRTAPSYHCGYFGCSVRYDEDHGYFSVINILERPYFLEEPGVNLWKCPEHGVWMYRKPPAEKDRRPVWRCANSQCQYTPPSH